MTRTYEGQAANCSAKFLRNWKAKQKVLQTLVKEYIDSEGVALSYDYGKTFDYIREGYEQRWK